MRFLLALPVGRGRSRRAGRHVLGRRRRLAAAVAAAVRAVTGAGGNLSASRSIPGGVRRCLPLLLVLLAALVAGACATPIAPSGGPADTTAPTLTASDPPDGSTNVTQRTLRLTFSERLAPAAGAAVTVTPTAETPPEVAVRGRVLEVTLPPLRDSTTYVVTVGTALADQRGVSLPAPITLALATGDAIDRGRIEGVVRDPIGGAGVGGLAVWAYALADSAAAPDPAAVAPDYRTETGADGAFRLEYLRLGRYAVVAVQDQNRNARADDGERYAVSPTPSLRARADSGAVVPGAVAPGAAGPGAAPATFWATSRDDTPPVAQRVRPVSDRRFAVRFSEPVTVRDARALAASLTVADSASGAPVAVTWYQPAGSAFEVSGQSERPLPPALAVTYAPGTPPALADSAGLAPLAFRLTTALPARADTVAARFDAFVPAAPDSVVLAGGSRPAVRFSSPPGGLLDRVRVQAGGEPLAVVFETVDGVTFRPDSAVALPRQFTITVPVGDSTRSQRYVVPGERDLGAIVGRVEADGPVVVEARPATGDPVQVSAEADGSFVADGLLPGPYTLRLWVDRDGDGRWSGGQPSPYVAPEPLVLLPEPVQVRARWETEIDPVTL